MRIVEELDVLDAGKIKNAHDVVVALDEVRAGIDAVVWPSGSDRFTIYPESGKKHGQGNGVKPIRDAFVLTMHERGWQQEAPFPIQPEFGESRIGAVDLAKQTAQGWILVEWETGNISSSHRSMNKMALALAESAAVAAVLIVPSTRLAAFLTDRIGNIGELRAYLGLWRAVPIAAGYLGIIVVEHDDESFEVARIRKGTDGRALR